MQDIVAFDETINKLNQSALNITNLSNEITNAIFLSNSCKNTANTITKNFNNNFEYKQAISSNLPYYFLNPNIAFYRKNFPTTYYNLPNSYFYFNDILKIKSFNITVIFNSNGNNCNLKDKINIKCLDHANNASILIGTINCTGQLRYDASLIVSCTTTKIFEYTPSNQNGLYYLEYEKGSSTNASNVYINSYGIYLGMELIY